MKIEFSFERHFEVYGDMYYEDKTIIRSGEMSEEEIRATGELIAESKTTDSEYWAFVGYKVS